MSRIVIVDDEPGIVEVIEALCRRQGHQTFPFSDPDAALKALAGIQPHLVIVDVKMEKVSGLDILRECQANFPHTVVVLITAFASVETAVEAMKLGAYDYLTKPFRSGSLVQCIDRAIDFQTALHANIAKRDFQDKPKLENLIGRSSTMQKIYRLVEKIADTDSTVLIQGETGTGKDLLAESLHSNSSRHHHPFASINCEGLSEQTLEAELFGHEKGYFGGNAEKIGLFEEAHNGTLFLDEIHSMSLQLQAKLLRVLQERKIRRIGATTSVSVNVRVIAASDVDIRLKIRDGAFREDLFYRLAVIPIDLPPLRDRLEDVPTLVDHFLEKFSRQTSTAMKKVDPALMERLTRYLWPGNTRELENVIERACALSENGSVNIDDFHTPLLRQRESSSDGSPVPWEVGKTLDAFVRNQEKKYIEMTLRYNQGSREKTASMLGISIATLYRKLDLKSQRQWP